MRKIATCVMLFLVTCNYSNAQRITVKYIESRLVTHQGVEFVGELKYKSEDLYAFPNWSNQGVLFMDQNAYRISNFNFNVTSNSFDSRIDRKKLFSFKNSMIDSVAINNRLFKRLGSSFYEVLFEKGNNMLLKKHYIKLRRGAINRLDLSEDEPDISIDYKYLIKSDDLFKSIDLNKKDVIRILENEKDQELLVEFIKEENLSFKNEKDIIKIFGYILENTDKLVQ